MLTLARRIGRAAAVAAFAATLVGGALAGPAPATADLPQFAALVERNRGAVVNIRAHRVDEREGEPMRPRLPFRGFGHPRELPPGHPDPDDEMPDRAQGSGFVISSDGFILTNAHVVAGADEVVVRMADKREFRAHIVGADRRSDVAVIKIPATGLAGVRLGDPAKLREGDWVVAIGSPFGFEQSVTAGIVSARARALPSENYVPFIQTDVAINPGNSGGPLFNLKGEVVGINSQIFSRTGGFMGLAFSIPIDMAMTIQAQLRDKGRVERGRIGVMIQEVSVELAESFGLPQASGALVSGVLEGTPASNAGLRQGDIVLEFDGRAVDNSTDLPRLVAATAPGSRVPIKYWREGASQQMMIGVGTLPDEDSAARPRERHEGEGRHDRLGLVVVEPNLLQRRQMQIEGGVMVERRRAIGGAAELQYGDVIEAVIRDGRRKDVKGLADYRRVVDGLPAGSTVSLLVRRGRQSTFVGLRVD